MTLFVRRQLSRPERHPLRKKYCNIIIDALLKRGTRNWLSHNRPQARNSEYPSTHPHFANTSRLLDSAFRWVGFVHALERNYYHL